MRFLSVGLVVLIAWVLWIEREFITTTYPGEKTWELYEAYPSHEQCIRWARAGCKGFEKLANESKSMEALPISDTEMGISYKDGRKGGVFIKFICLPDTIDPRK